MLPKMRVGLSPIWGAMMLVIAAIDLFLYAATHETLQLALGVIIGLAGLSHLMGSLLVVDGSIIELKNPLGMTLKTFQISSPDELEVEGKKLWIKVGHERKKISGLMANSAQWRALTEAIAAAKAKTDPTA